MNQFKPPFCPNPRCPEHGPRPNGSYSLFRSWGSYATRTFGTVPRFRCTICGVTFSSQTFSIDYYAKRVIGYEDIGRRLSSCESLSAIGRALHASTDLVSNRISRAARQALAFTSRVRHCGVPEENLAADGFESFCVSQYFPNNIQVLVGSESQFVYLADHASLRRKGCMTDAQRRRRAILDESFRPPPRALESSFARVLDESLRVLSDGARATISLWTDEKKEYVRAIKRSPIITALAASSRLVHCTVSSRRARTKDNPLFPVNYLDREIRKDLHEHVRETTCFGRNVNRQMERFALYLYWHNFRKPHRARGDERSHAEVSGLDRGFIAKANTRIWRERAWLSHLLLSPADEDTWLRRRKTPLRVNNDYLPRFAGA